MPREYELSAHDWKFKSVAEFEAQLDARYHALGLRLFQFYSRSNKVSAYVLFAGRGAGAGFKFSCNNEVLHVALDSVDRLAKPQLGGVVKISLPRQRAEAMTLENVTVRSSFSLEDLDEARGRLSSGGVGAGVGVGILLASAEKHGQELFSCQRLGVEFGRLGGSATSLMGTWHVALYWND